MVQKPEIMRKAKCRHVRVILKIFHNWYGRALVVGINTSHTGGTDSWSCYAVGPWGMKMVSVRPLRFSHANGRLK